jgi:Sec-independent protein secretion pathway component TatC
MLEFFFKNLLNYGEKALEAAKTVSNVLPASSLIFLLGVAVGYFLSK